MFLPSKGWCRRVAWPRFTLIWSVIYIWHDTLSGKVFKPAYQRALWGGLWEASIKQTASQLFESTGTKAKSLRKIIECNLKEYGWLERCILGHLNCTPFFHPTYPETTKEKIVF